MGFTVYANCYAKVGCANRDAALARLSALHGKSLFVPHAEPIGVVTTDIAKVVTPLAGYEPLAWCRTKVAFALNPRFAFAVFVLRLKSTASSLGPDILILLRDDGEEYGDVSRFQASRVTLLFARSLVESPLWLLNWLWGLRG
jgi:hypothetical protein